MGLFVTCALGLLMEKVARTTYLWHYD